MAGTKTDKGEEERVGLQEDIPSIYTMADDCLYDEPKVEVKESHRDRSSLRVQTQVQTQRIQVRRFDEVALSS